MARNLFREQNDLEHLVHKITTESQGLMQCARCCVYILDGPAKSNKPEVNYFKQTKILQNISLYVFIGYPFF